MKKTLVSALTTAIVVGAASTTFAAANPFSDVPADHWAYDAVAQLAADGVIGGYGDATFQGDRNITRYEMAQMVAKAMAKKDVSATDKAMIDKLAAEFADELNNLGVRVSNLEKNADKVKWNGELEYTYTSNRYKFDENGDHYSKKVNDNNLLFRLEPTAEVNSNWDVHARIDAATEMDKDAADDTEDHLTLKRVWAQGNYKNFTLKFGKYGSEINNTLVFDNPFSGVGVEAGNKLKVAVEAGRVGADELNGAFDLDADPIQGVNPFTLFGKAANYQGIGLSYDFGKLSTKAAYQHFDWNAGNGMKAAMRQYLGSDKDDAGIWSLAAKYAFDKNVAFNAEYAGSDYDKLNNLVIIDGNKSDDSFDKSYAFELNYKGAQQENQGTWGAWAAYRYLGSTAGIAPTYDAIHIGYKGWELGANYTLFKNTVATLRYGDTKNLIDNDYKNKVLFGRVDFFF